VEGGSPHAWHAFTSCSVFRLETDGLTCAQRWERAGFLGLKNDERVLFRAKMQVRIALLEIRSVLDEQRLEVVDLFSSGPVPLRVVDRSLANKRCVLRPWLHGFSRCVFWRVQATAW